MNVFNSMLHTSKRGIDRQEDGTEDYTECTAGNQRENWLLWGYSKLVWYVSYWSFRMRLERMGGREYSNTLRLRISNIDEKQQNSVLGNPVNPKDKLTTIKIIHCIIKLQNTKNKKKIFTSSRKKLQVAYKIIGIKTNH